MHGLVSILPPPYDQQVENLWKELETEHGLLGIKVTPYPHFSWQIAQEYDLNRLEEIMLDIAGSARPFNIQTAGLGIFTGPRPVIFISIVKTRTLIDFHAMLWEKAQAAGQGLSPHYSPQAWVPHISLAYEDVDQANMAGVMARLSFRSYVWELAVENLALIYEPSGEIGELKYHFKFRKSNESNPT